MKIKRYECEVGEYSCGKMKSFFTKNAAIDWLKEMSLHPYMTIGLRDRWRNKNYKIRNRYDEFTFIYEGGVIQMVKNVDKFKEDNWRELS